MKSTEWIELFKQINGRPPSPQEYQEALQRGEIEAVASRQEQAGQAVSGNQGQTGVTSVQESVQTAYQEPVSSVQEQTPAHDLASQESVTNGFQGSQPSDHQQVSQGATPTDFQQGDPTGFQQVPQEVAPTVDQQPNQSFNQTGAGPVPVGQQPNGLGNNPFAEGVPAETAQKSKFKLPAFFQDKKNVGMVLGGLVAVIAIAVGAWFFMNTGNLDKLEAKASYQNVAKAFPENDWQYNVDNYVNHPYLTEGLPLTDAVLLKSAKVEIVESEYYFTYEDFAKEMEAEDIKSLEEINEELETYVGTKKVSGMAIPKSGYGSPAYIFVDNGQRYMLTYLNKKVFEDIPVTVFDPITVKDELSDFEGEWEDPMYGNTLEFKDGIVSDEESDYYYQGLYSLEEYANFVKVYNKANSDQLYAYTEEDIASLTYLPSDYSIALTNVGLDPVVYIFEEEDGSVRRLPLKKDKKAKADDSVSYKQ